MSSDPSFFEQEETWFNRRGVDIFCANDIEELSWITNVRPPNLIISAGPPDGHREHNFREIVPEAIPLVILARANDDQRSLIEYENGFQSTVVHRPYGNQVMRTTAAALETVNRQYIRMLVQLQSSSQSKSGGFGFSHNVSPTGILLETKKELALGDRLQLSFMLPGAKEMTEVTAEVIREAPSIKPATHCYGLQFLDLSAEHRAHIGVINSNAEGADETGAALRSTTVAYGT
jgi:hypothetical protein